MAVLVLAEAAVTALRVVFGFRRPPGSSSAGPGSILGFGLIFGTTTFALYGAELALPATPALRRSRSAHDACQALLRAVRMALVAFAAAVLTGIALPARAQDIEPRAYSNAPVGVNFLIAGYAYTRGGVIFGPSLPITNPNLHTSNAVIAYARVLDLWGMSAKFDATVPYQWLSGTADFAGQTVPRDVSGFANSAFRLSVNLYGAPALTLKEFAGWEQDIIIGASFRVTAPWSQYDDSKLINIGTNRWSFKPEVGISKAIGPWTLEGTVAATFYTDNNDFFGAKSLAQKPIYSAAGARDIRLSLRCLGFARCHLFCRRPNDRQRRSEQRPPAELAPRRDIGVPDEP